MNRDRVYDRAIISANLKPSFTTSSQYLNIQGEKNMKKDNK